MYTRIRISLIALCTLSILGAASSSFGAVTFTAETTTSLGNPLNALEIGELITINVTLRSDGEELFALRAAATGYDPSVASFVSGEAVPRLLVSICLPEGCFGGADNSGLAAGPLVESLSNPLGPEVTFAASIATAGTTNTGEIDLGVSGMAGDPQFRLIFLASGPGSTTIKLGSDPSFGHYVVGEGGAFLPAVNAEVALAVIPEPATAVLLGMGLALLASHRCRTALPTAP